MPRRPKYVLRIKEDDKVLLKRKDNKFEVDRRLWLMLHLSLWRLSVTEARIRERVLQARIATKENTEIEFVAKCSYFSSTKMKLSCHSRITSKFQPMIYQRRKLSGILTMTIFREKSEVIHVRAVKRYWCWGVIHLMKIL